ncbi:MAG: dihydrofolate reductase [Thermobacillus sp. ZCTH02-B1]|uniref:dihydrofolate reductase n=1 Tax=Thermobacillus sp. ZCTH02-B1 TaxID=1858795 RepID=UPI000B554379|nr:dihydrofolate reductase [Thermobacillus sp. ZCTH02-B1]OUM97014.1 MAG: dihydrofolate reductase [Thermobacillus sp. ZCTH02-B1]
MTITLIAAMARNRVIGRNNGLPWRLPDDMKFFMRSTVGRTVLMGRRTFESLPGGPLKNRRNVVLTRRTDYRPDGCEVVHSVEEALERYGGDELMVAGGAEVYRLFLPHADRMLLTEVEAEVEGDAYFPKWDPEEWMLVASERHPADERHAWPFAFNTYVRRRNRG